MLQPLDVSVNEVFKREMKKQFGDWYAEQLMVDMNSGKNVDDYRVDMHTSVVKSIPFQWLMKTCNWLQEQYETIQRGFTEAGIANVLLRN